jgi:SAM-dependent methyltransferase
VTIDLAARGHEVTALDLDADLLAALTQRAAGLPVRTVAADAREFDLGRRFALVIAPMQTVQLLGRDGRRSFLRHAARHVEPGGTVAIALADALDAFDAEHDQPPLPDMHEDGGVVYASRPLAVVDEGERAAIHRLREVVAPDGTRSQAPDVIRLDKVDADTVAAEGAEAGLRPLAPLSVPATDEYVGSTVVMLRG